MNAKSLLIIVFVYAVAASNPPSRFHVNDRPHSDTEQAALMSEETVALKIAKALETNRDTVWPLLKPDSAPGIPRIRLPPLSAKQTAALKELLYGSRKALHRLLVTKCDGCPNAPDWSSAVIEDGKAMDRLVDSLGIYWWVVSPPLNKPAVRAHVQQKMLSSLLDWNSYDQFDRDDVVAFLELHAAAEAFADPDYLKDPEHIDARGWIEATKKGPIDSATHTQLIPLIPKLVAQQKVIGITTFRHPMLSKLSLEQRRAMIAALRGVMQLVIDEKVKFYRIDYGGLAEIEAMWRFFCQGKKMGTMTEDFAYKASKSMRRGSSAMQEVSRDHLKAAFQSMLAVQATV